MESVNDMRIKNGLMLLLTAFIWGTAFVAQSVGMDYLEPFTFNGVRSLIGGAALLPCIWILQKLNGRSKDTGTKKDLLTGGLACGCACLWQVPCSRLVCSIPVWENVDLLPLFIS